MSSRLAPASPGWNHQYADLPGLRMHYVRSGTGDPLILLHGWPEFWWSWHRNIPALEQHFDVVAPDLRGFGQTDKPPGTAFAAYDWGHHVADVLALADALGFERFNLAAHDVGAGVAQLLAREHGERLTRLFLFNGAHPGVGNRWVAPTHVSEIWYQSFQQLPWAAELVGYSRDTCRIYFANMLAHWTHDPRAFDDHIEHFVDNFMRPGNLQGGFNWYITSHPKRMDVVRNGPLSLAPIKTPTRFLWGRHDPVLLAAWADNLGEYFCNLVIEFAEEAGHFVHFECNELANESMIEFFSGN